MLLELIWFSIQLIIVRHVIAIKSLCYRFFANTWGDSDNFFIPYLCQLFVRHHVNFFWQALRNVCYCDIISQ